jgi:hypothetical protein
MTTEARERARAWKAWLVTSSLVAGAVGWGWLAVQEAARGPAAPASSQVKPSEEVAQAWSEEEVEALPPIPSLRRPVAATGPSR